MERKSIKNLIYISCVLYIFLRMCDFFRNEYRLNEKTDFYFLVGLCASFILYYWSKTFFKFSLKDAKKLNDYHVLKYKLLMSSDDKYMYKLYVKSPFEYSWMELDYSLTISQGCDIYKAVNFVNTYSNGGKLKDLMISKSENKINLDCSHYDNVVTRNITFLMLGFLIVSSFIFYYITFIYK